MSCIRIRLRNALQGGISRRKVWGKRGCHKGVLQNFADTWRIVEKCRTEFPIVKNIADKCKIAEKCRTEFPIIMAQHRQLCSQGPPVQGRRARREQRIPGLRLLRVSSLGHLGCVLAVHRRDQRDPVMIKGSVAAERLHRPGANMHRGPGPGVGSPRQTRMAGRMRILVWKSAAPNLRRKMSDCEPPTSGGEGGDGGRLGYDVLIRKGLDIQQGLKNRPRRRRHQ